MSVSRDLQAALSRINADQAGGKTYGKTELGGLVRELRIIRDEALEQEKALEEAVAGLRAAGDTFDRLGDRTDLVFLPILGTVR
ncbi:MAG: hypothetical protein QOI38_2055 [Sphingomonadales bacterium]|jgi:hypothetical protein|nr:hypothetical protein [Sphingomonadales bacterium]